MHKTEKFYASKNNSGFNRIKKGVPFKVPPYYNCAQIVKQVYLPHPDFFGYLHPSVRS